MDPIEPENQPRPTLPESSKTAVPKLDTGSPKPKPRARRPQQNQAPMWIWLPAICFTSILLLFFPIVFFVVPHMTAGQVGILYMMFCIFAGLTVTFMGGTVLANLELPLSGDSRISISACSGVALTLLFWIYPPFWFVPAALAAPSAWQAFASPAAIDGFGKGGATDDFSGSWKVELFEIDGSTPYSVDAGTAGSIPYPPEVAICEASGSVFLMEAMLSTQEGSKLWGEGRVTDGEYVTMQTWTEASSRERNVVSVVLGKVERHTNKPVKIVGRRLGVSRDGKEIRPSIIEFTKIPK